MEIRRNEEKKLNNKKSINLQFDEDGNFIEVDNLEFVVFLTIDEYKNSVKMLEEVSVTALQKGIDVYTGFRSFDTVNLCGYSELVLSRDSTIIFTTLDNDKFDILEDIVKDFTSKVSEHMSIIKKLEKINNKKSME